MTGERNLASELGDTLEAHELAVKRALETLGTVQQRMKRAANEETDEFGGQTATADPDDRDATVPVAEVLEPVGKAMERHEASLEEVVRTLDDHKGAIRGAGEVERQDLEEALERARRRARIEPTPPGSELGEAGDASPGSDPDPESESGSEPEP